MVKFRCICFFMGVLSQNGIFDFIQKLIFDKWIFAYEKMHVNYCHDSISSQVSIPEGPK